MFAVKSLGRSSQFGRFTRKNLFFSFDLDLAFVVSLSSSIAGIEEVAKQLKRLDNLIPVLL